MDVITHLKQSFPVLLHSSLTSARVWNVIDDCHLPSDFLNEANEGLILFNGITFDSPLVQELEAFHRTVGLICYLRYRHEKDITYVNSGYSYHCVTFLLEWLKRETESTLVQVMNSDKTEESCLLEELEDDSEYFADLDVAMKNFILS